ncbi:MAG TPA: GNAT family N-acetyltransferase [Caulobacteraceae bacterium]|jgi:GNAT superfamily N-acetyltransferase
MPQALDIRPIGPADIALTGRLDPRIAANQRQQDHLSELLGAGLSWAAFAGEAEVGFAIVTRHFFGHAFIDLLFVAEAQRRSGAGSALMARCVDAATGDRVFTSTNESNAPMRALLAKAGWLPAGMVDYLDPGDPELILVKLRA